MSGWVDEAQEELSSEAELGSRERSLGGLETFCSLMANIGLSGRHPEDLRESVCDKGGVWTAGRITPQTARDSC